MRLVFVSSTFKDMQFERDELKNRVAPRIDSFLASYGENVHFGDLRWGVNTTEMSEEESAKKVLKVCLDEIDDCRPYMIVFIGERYGWIPSQELILEAARIRGIESIDPDISVTNLEIEYGALLNPDFEGHILFYFRNLDTSEMDIEDKKIYEAESNIHKQKLDALKDVIQEKYPGYVRYYDAKYDKNTKTIVNLSPVMEMVYNDLCHIFKIDLDKFESLPNYQRALRNSETRFEKYSKNAYRRKDFNYSMPKWNVLENVFDNRYENAPIMTNLSGDAGAGKKTNLAIMYEEAKKDQVINSYPYAVGLDEYTKDREELIDFITNVLEDELGIEHQEPSTDLDLRKIHMATLIEHFSQTDKHVRFFIMGCTKEAVNLLRYIEAVLDSRLINISFFVTYEQETIFNDLPAPYYLFGNTRFVAQLELEDKLGIIRAILKNKHKELPESVIKLITTKEGSNNALYLSLIVERLLLLDHQDFQNIRNMGDGMIAIERYMSKIVNESGSNIKDISKELLKELKERINPTMIPIVLRLLTYDYKLTNKEIENFFSYMSFGWDAVDYSLFIHSIPSLFKESSLVSPYLEFKIPEIKEAAKELVEEWEVENYSENIIQFLEQIEEGQLEKYERLLKAYRGFNKPEKTAELYLDIIDGFDTKKINEFERKIIKKLRQEYQEETGYYFEVSKYIVDLLNEGKVKNPAILCSYFYIFLDIYLVDTETKRMWVNIFVNTIGYIYDVYKSNKNNDNLFFLLMVGLDNIDGYFNSGDFILYVDDDSEYQKSYEKACELYSKKTSQEKYEQLETKYEADGYHNQHLIFYSIKRLATELVAAIIDDQEAKDEYVEDNEEFFDYLYNNRFVENIDEKAAHKILEEENPDIELFNEDKGVSLFILGAKFFIALENQEFDDALDYFKKYANILLKYRDSYYFFREDEQSNNIGPFLLSIPVVEYLMIIRVEALFEFPEEYQKEFESLYIDAVYSLLPIIKLYLADHYEDVNMICNYMDSMQAIMTFKPEEGINENVDLEEMSYHFSFIMGLVDTMIEQKEPARMLVNYIYLKSNFIGYISKDIEKQNINFINMLSRAYWFYMNYHDEMDWYESIIEIIASYLDSTDQQENYVLYKQIYKDFYQDVYEESYLDFKKSVKFKLKEKEYYHAKNLLNHLGDEEDE